MSSVCSNCGGSDIDLDPSRGDAVCMNCGSVLEDNIIVSEVQFQENSIGGTSAIGQFVSSEGNKTAISLGSGFRHGLGQESRAVTLENGRKRINHLGHQLQMNQHCIDTAYNFYKLAVNKRLTRGRRTSHVVAACLYLVCRTEKTPHMLLDFSDILQIDVFTLGRAYLKLAQELYINLPAIDPCLYIQRFAHKLEFGDKEHDVAMTALRLVSRMKRDWIHHGRRPSGLCGAALLVASRLHSFRRSVKEVVKVVRISDTTIRKRLGEFKDTPSSQLTVDEFQKIDLEEEQDPPCFTQARKKAKQQAEEIGNPAIDNELEKFQTEIDNMLGIGKERSYNVTKKPDPGTVSEDPQGVSDDLSLDTNTTWPLGTNGFNVSTPVLTTKSEAMPNAIRGGETPDEQPGEKDHAEGEDQCEELDLTGLDDTELDRCLLNDEEIKVKTKIWMEENKEYLEKMKEKEEREALEREQGVNKPEKKKRKYKTKKHQPASTAGEAIEKMLVERKISSKINYDVLRDLETSQSSKPAEPAAPLQLDPPPAVKATAKNEPEFLKPSIPLRTGGRKREAIRPLASLPNTLKRSKVSQSPIQDAKEHLQNTTGIPQPQTEAVAQATTHERELVVESGPVEYERTGGERQENEAAAEDDYYDEEEEDGHVSLTQLIGHMYQDGLEDEYGEYGEDY